MSSPPTKEEMQYASDVIHGKRKLDRYIILGSTIAGGIFGIAVGFSSAQANSEPLILDLPSFALLFVHSRLA